MHNISSIGQSCSMIRSHKQSTLLSLDKDFIKNELARSGVILFRGFQLELDDFSAFTKTICRKVTLDPARQFASERVQLVDSGLDAIPLHCENGLTPFLPDVLLFMCEIPAKQGSATTYCDGELVWEKLSVEAKSYFSSHHFYFSRTIPQALWTKYLANELGISDASLINHSLFEKMRASLSQHHFELQENGDLFAKLKIHLAHSSYFSDRLNFANSLIGPSFNYQNPEIEDEQGFPIPVSFIQEFEQISAECTVEHQWEKQDFLLIDNTRFMHGRRAIDDPDRKIYAAMGYL
ncbi:Taurine catabolism dioxygenase TauD, TfdA family [Legionella santicrucis]|uniref:Taurine catabolism dioxygenase TauD, TfdA family n=1 Tax=Legionella santicrucis TaxID=45074 RepID=A0A0W0YSV8_9GAMM|nr:TauD/TfdA family dioxygenase [Legionella santicrucis]KTD59574.1 Taurine catabolism dioxygenase TauD, TfdA family [Legionella santicrucis]